MNTPTISSQFKVMNDIMSMIMYIYVHAHSLHFIYFLFFSNFTSQSSLSVLVTKMSSAVPHFIRCLKPNKLKVC